MHSGSRRPRRPEQRRAMLIGGGGITIPGPSNGSPVIDFAKLFTPGTVLQSIQTDLGLTYGGTMLAGGTSNTVVATLSGSLLGIPVPILVKCSQIGTIGVDALFDVYFDGGTTPAMVGILPSAGVPYPLTGAGAGLSVSLSAGSPTSLDNTWKATCSALADQSGNANNYAQAGATKQPVMSTGLGGRAGLLFDGSNDELDNSTLSYPASVSYRFVFRNVSYTTSTAIFGPNTAAAAPIIYQVGTSPNMRQFNNGDGALTNGGAVVGSWVRGRSWFNNAGTDYLRLGAVNSTGIATGAGRTGTGMRIGFSANGGFVLFANIEVLAMVVLNAEPSAVQDAAFDAAVTALYGGTVGL